MNTLPLGLVIGTYGAVPYIHLQLESRRRFNPEMACLVIDDGSPDAAELSELCRRYDAEFQGRKQRMGHVPGDMQAFIDGHRWARDRSVGLLVKFSRRWIPISPWVENAIALWRESEAPTLNNRCEANGFGFRSECVAMDVSRWDDLSVEAPIRERIAQAISIVEHGTFAWQQQLFLVEAIIHEASMFASRRGSDQWNKYLTKHPPHPGTGHYAAWSWMGTSRASRVPGVLWHEACRTADYLAQLEMWGINDYTLSDLINPAANLKLDQ